MNNKPLLEVYPNAFSKKESVSILELIKAKLSKTLYTLLSIDENKEPNKLLIVLIIISEKLAVLEITSSKRTS